MQILTTQFDVRSGKQCNDCTPIIKLVQKIQYKSNGKLYICYVVFTAEYDSVNGDFLFNQKPSLKLKISIFGA